MKMEQLQKYAQLLARVGLNVQKGQTVFVVESHEFACDAPFSIAIDTEDVAFYRTEIFDMNKNLRIALGNPIWNEKT